MQFSIFALAILASIAAAKDLQVTYFADHHCKTYARQVDYSSSQEFGIGGNNCINVHYPSLSLKVEACAHETCTCLFYYSQNCNGEYATLKANAPGALNCIQNAKDFNSFRCFHYR